MIKLAVLRYRAAPDATLGVLFIQGVFHCYTLERPVLSEGKANVPEVTCIPNGNYPVKMQASSHFGRALPHVFNVPGRSAVEIHAGNRVPDCKGCVMVGYAVDSRTPSLINSTAALNDLVQRLDADSACTLEVSGTTLG